MYESQEARNDDIEELAGADHAELRERLLAGTVSFPEAVQGLPADLWEGRFERTRGGPTLPLRAAPLMRVREIEIHHADLDVGYSPDAWPPGFAEELVDGMVSGSSPTRGLPRPPLDADRTGRWAVGDDGLVVTGPVAHLGWWLTGRTPSDQVVEQPRRAADDRELVMAYTGAVRPGGDPDVRELAGLRVTKVAVDPRCPTTATC